MNNSAQFRFFHCELQNPVNSQPLMGFWSAQAFFYAKHI